MLPLETTVTVFKVRVTLYSLCRLSAFIGTFTKVTFAVQKIFKSCVEFSGHFIVLFHCNWGYEKEDNFLPRSLMCFFKHMFNKKPVKLFFPFPPPLLSLLSSPPHLTLSFPKIQLDSGAPCFTFLVFCMFRHMHMYICKIHFRVYSCSLVFALYQAFPVEALQKLPIILTVALLT